ncbi:class I SAM-dependent methyltransferase [Micromonospora sp. WMMD1120]|uniref:class I SAM-dependent methyltransferase n=1 Tax=Micromonospora sp. WMMD1120 TaxID=3016106 RepID=UPI0024174446|nr:class I SAM-dependent methyltransferase [Micromonospora sp. WMMD1120]MDG4806767.1 class I SAM-dependent methyltransferase [Micromonospora sp. WMMD1120]
MSRTGPAADVAGSGLPARDPGPSGAGTASSADAPVRATAAHRQRWAVETMTVAPDDQVLEIGCGRGAAVSLVADRLTSGRIVAVDRAATMVRLATRRNLRHIGAGRAEIRCAEFETTDLPTAHFTRIFAVNVSLFWLGDAAQQVARIRSLLAPEGRLYVFGERPTVAHATANLTATELLLRTHGFTTTRLSATRGQGRVLTCVTGTP